MYRILSSYFPKTIAIKHLPDVDSTSENVPAISQDLVPQSLHAWDETPSGRSRRTKAPFLNGLAHTCRRASGESSHILFQEHNFSLEDWSMLELFINTFPPGKVQAVKEITIRGYRFLRPGGGPARRIADIHSSRPRSLKMFKAFTNLTALHIGELRYFGGVSDRSLDPQIFIMNLMKATTEMEFLQTIVIESNEFDAVVPYYTVDPLDFDAIPGWTYSLTSQSHPVSVHIAVLTEVLQRVHMPLWPPKSQGRRISKRPKIVDNRLDDEGWETEREE